MKSRIVSKLSGSALPALPAISVLAGLALFAGCGGSGTRQSAFQTPPPPPPALAIMTATLPSGIAGLAYDQPIQVSGGVAPFSWTLLGTLPHNLSLSSSTGNQVTITGTPDTAGQNASFSIQVKDSAGQVATQAYSVSILFQADVTLLSPSNLDFGNQIVGSASKILTATLTNTANSEIAISGIITGGTNAADFDQTSSSCAAALAAGASCTINLTFHPAQAGPRTATILVSDDVAGSPQGVSLSGVGLTSGSNVTLSLLDIPFGTQLVGTTSPPWPVVLTNYGTSTLNIANITVDGSFTETDDCVPAVPSLATCTLKVTFTPAQAGDLSGTLSVSDDAVGSPQTISLSGKGSSNTPPLTGGCFATCIGHSQDQASCPVGAPSITPDEASVYPCGPIMGEVPVDDARTCHIAWHTGHCVTQ